MTEKQKRACTNCAHRFHAVLRNYVVCKRLLQNEQGTRKIKGPLHRGFYKRKGILRVGIILNKDNRCKKHEWGKK